MSQQRTCADRIADAVASREASLAELFAYTDESDDDYRDDAREELDNYALGISSEIRLRVDISTGGPAEWLIVPIDRPWTSRGPSRMSWEIAGPVQFHFADWFDHAETTVDDDSALYRYAADIVECIGEELPS